MAAIARPGDLVITVGCGDVTKVAPLIVRTARSIAWRASGDGYPPPAPVDGGAAGRGAAARRGYLGRLLLAVLGGRARSPSPVSARSPPTRWSPPPPCRWVRRWPARTSRASPSGRPGSRRSAAASVTRPWPSTLLVTVTERTAVLAVRQGSDFLLVDGAGRRSSTGCRRRPRGAVAGRGEPGRPGAAGRTSASSPARCRRSWVARSACSPPPAGTASPWSSAPGSRSRGGPPTTRRSRPRSSSALLKGEREHRRVRRTRIGRAPPAIATSRGSSDDRVTAGNRRS